MLYPGAVVAPDDISKLSRVCAIICDESGIESSSRAAQAVAAHVFRLFMNGLTEEWELLGIMRHRQTHQFAHLHRSGQVTVNDRAAPPPALPLRARLPLPSSCLSAGRGLRTLPTRCRNITLGNLS